MFCSTLKQKLFHFISYRQPTVAIFFFGQSARFTTMYHKSMVSIVDLLRGREGRRLPQPFKTPLKRHLSFISQYDLYTGMIV